MIGESLEQRDLFIRERSNFTSPQAHHANRCTLPQERHRQYRAKRHLTGPDLVLRIAPDVMDVGDPSIKDRAAYGDISVGRPWKPAAGFLDLWLGHAMVSLERNHLTIEPVQSGECRLAQPSGAPYDCIEDRLQVSWRTADDAQDLGGSGLLLQRFGEVTVAFLQFLEQPNVLDGDDGLIGESLQELNLRKGERAHLKPANHDSADCDALAQ